MPHGSVAWPAGANWRLIERNTHCCDQHPNGASAWPATAWQRVAMRFYSVAPLISDDESTGWTAPLLDPFSYTDQCCAPRTQRRQSSPRRTPLCSPPCFPMHNCFGVAIGGLHCNIWSPRFLVGVRCPRLALG